MAQRKRSSTAQSEDEDELELEVLVVAGAVAAGAAEGVDDGESEPLGLDEEPLSEELRESLR